MSVKLCLRATGDLPPGMPLEIYSTFATEEEALSQAIADLKTDNRSHLPQRIENEAGGVILDREELLKAAQDD